MDEAKQEILQVSDLFDPLLLMLVFVVTLLNKIAVDGETMAAFVVEETLKAVQP